MKLFFSALFIVGAAVAHFYALNAGIYSAQQAEGTIWLDNVLHAIVGAGFTLSWVWLLGRFAPRLSLVFIASSAVLFVVVMAVAWELLERGFYLFFTAHALGLRVYPQTLQESILDSFSNIGGAVVLLLLLAGSRRFKRGTPEVIEE